MNYTKTDLRVHYKKLRQQLSDADIEEQSLAIANQLLKMPIWDHIYYHIFLSIQKHKEVDTEFILHLLAGKDKEVLISKSNFESRGMTHFLLTENTKIKKNEYEIPEPVDGIEVPSSKIEVVFIPLLAYDYEGNRVGYGKGFYDNFLKDCNPKTLKIGLSFFEPVGKIENVFDTDVKLDFCVTPVKIYDFRL